MHQNTRALDPRDDIRMGKQRFNETASNGSVLDEFGPVEVEADDDVAFRRVDQRLDDSRVGEDISRHVDRQLGATNLLGVDAFKIFSRSVMDLDLGSAPTPRRDRQNNPRDENCAVETDRHWPSCECCLVQLIVVSGCKVKGRDDIASGGGFIG